MRPTHRLRAPTTLAGHVVTLVGVAIIAMATLQPAPTTAVEPRWACLVCGDTGVADVLVNVILYVPYGVGLTLIGMRPVRALALIVATTFAVELLQYRVLIGRDGTLSDVVTNSLGGGIGVLVATHWRSLAGGNVRLTASTALAGALVWAAVLAISARALEVTARAAGAVVWWKPVMPPFPQAAGALDQVVIDGRPTVNREVLAAPTAAPGSITVRATVRTRRDAARSAPIVWVGRGDREDVVLSQIGPNLITRFQVRGAEWRLVSPAFSLPDGFAGDPGAARASGTTATHVSARAEAHTVTIESSSPNVTRRRSVHLAPTLGWTLLVPSGIHVGLGYRWLSSVWICAFLFPVGYWAVTVLVRVERRGARDSSVRQTASVSPADPTSMAMACAALMIVFVSLGIIPPAMAGSVTEWWEWLAAFVAVVAGGASGYAVQQFVFITKRHSPSFDGIVLSGHHLPGSPQTAGPQRVNRSLD